MNDPYSSVESQKKRNNLSWLWLWLSQFFQFKSLVNNNNGDIRKKTLQRFRIRKRLTSGPADHLYPYNSSYLKLSIETLYSTLQVVSLSLMKIIVDTFLMKIIDEFIDHWWYKANKWSLMILLRLLNWHTYTDQILLAIHSDIPIRWRFSKPSQLQQLIGRLCDLKIRKDIIKKKWRNLMKFCNAFIQWSKLNEMKRWLLFTTL